MTFLERISLSRSRLDSAETSIGSPTPSSASPALTASSASAGGQVRLHFLDGIRGLAAFYVLIFHSLTIAVPQDGQDLSPVISAMRSVFGYGHFAVATFIVLSGFSLTLPMAQALSMQLRDGFAHYLRRRCRRVFPPYYAALALSIIAILASSLIPGADTSAREEALTFGSVVSHLFFVHNWNVDWVFRINGPMWSVATEFQIYFLFPLVLLPLWRRVGPAATVLICWVLAAAVQFGLPGEQNLSWAAPWFVGSFALGMWAAFIGFSPASQTSRLKTVRWGWGALMAFGTLVAILALGGGSWPLLYLDAIVSVMSACWILACVARSGATDRSVNSVSPRRIPSLNTVLESKPMVLLGSFSYSTYVLQHPLLRLTEALLGRSSLSFEVILWVQLALGTPVILAMSWLFAQFFELPFTTGSPLLSSLRQRLLPQTTQVET